MKPIKFPQVNLVLAEDQGQYLPLPVCVEGGQTVSCWKLSLGERLKLLVTGRLWLQQLNFSQPLQPQLPGVDDPFKVSTGPKGRRFWTPWFGCCLLLRLWGQP